MALDGNQEFLGEFAAESREHLDAAESCLLRLTREAGDREAVQACFRALHTVKGGAGFMGLDLIQGLAHVAEQLLDAVRENRAKAESTVCDALLAAITRLRELVDAIGGEAPAGDDDALRQRLQALLPPEDPDDYKPSHADKRRAEATSRRVQRPDPASIDELASELVALDPADPRAFAACLDRLEAMARQQEWTHSASEVLARMRDLIGRLGDPATRANAHVALLSQAEALVKAVVSARLRRSAAPAAKAAAAANPAAGTTPPSADAVPDPPSVADFCAESEELLAKAEAVLLASADPDPSQVEDLFRSFHTVKGMAAYLGHPRIEQLAHAVEGRLTAARDGNEIITSSLHALALAGIDGLRSLVTELRRSGADRGPWPPAAAACARQTGILLADGQEAEEELPPDVPRLGDLLVQTGQATREQIEEAASRLKPGERLGDKLVESGKVAREVVEQAAAKQQELVAKAQGDGFARVSTARLEELVNLVGELLITQAQVSQDENVRQAAGLAALVGRQARVVRSLQSLALGLRLVPLRATFQKMARAVHDTARRLGKQIELDLAGDEVEVDRTLVEAIADPLLHMVRNAVDHGIESAAVRSAAGKAAIGHVRLSAAHSGDHVVVQLEDDGKGLDPERLIAKAKEKGLVASDAVLGPAEAWNLIFLPGFSTAEQVTGISGRGVGMDVVKRNLERVKGRVDIESVVGEGSIFTIRLPLTTAILDAMTMRVGQETFLVPTTAVVEALRPAPDQVQDVLGRGRIIQARGQLVPVVMLGAMFGIDDAETDPTRAVLLVIERDGGPVALQVDELLGLQQVVIKPLDGERQHHPGVAGAAILGDGRVGLILDPKQLLAA